MSRAKNAFAAGMARATVKGAEGQGDNPDVVPPKGSGNWSKMALDSMETRLIETREALEQAHGAFHAGVLSGAIPVEVPADQIIDELGSDRILDTSDAADDTESFEALVANIRDRGLRVPLRLRPKDPKWRPDPEHPQDMSGQIFLLQSGRRRLAACQRLGITPIAFLSFAGDTPRSEDLQERFFENAARKNLSLVEKLYSIGLIAQEIPSATQSQIAEMIGVSGAYVSRGVALVEHFDRLQQDLDLANTTAAEIDQALKAYREAERSDTPEARRKREERKQSKASKPALPFRTKAIGKMKVSLKVRRDGIRVLALEGVGLDDSTLERIMAFLEQESGKGRGGA